MEDSQQVIPDLMIYTDPDEGIEVRLNDQYYPGVSIDTAYGVDHPYVRENPKRQKVLSMPWRCEKQPSIRWG